MTLERFGHNEDRSRLEVEDVLRIILLTTKAAVTSTKQVRCRLVGCSAWDAVTFASDSEQPMGGRLLFSGCVSVRST